ncbi:response regulator transcription factor [Herpetosiphon llansteffanensis]
MNQLTKREFEVAELLSQGLLNREIAAQLCVSEVAIEQHLTRIYRKLAVRNRVEAVLKLGGMQQECMGSHSIQDLSR